MGSRELAVLRHLLHCWNVGGVCVCVCVWKNAHELRGIWIAARGDRYLRCKNIFTMSLGRLIALEILLFM